MKALASAAEQLSGTQKPYNDGKTCINNNKKYKITFHMWKQKRNRTQEFEDFRNLRRKKKCGGVS